MKYSHLFFLIFFLVHFKTMAQQNLSLKTVSFEVNDPWFYVDKVIDSRKEQYLGKLKDPEGYEVKLRLHGGASKAVREFADISLPRQETSQGITIKIKALNIQDSRRRMNEGVVAIARAHVELIFLEESGGESRELFHIKHNEDQVFSLDDTESLFNTHERRVRAALEYCLLAFVDNRPRDKNDIQPIHFPKDGSVPGFSSRLDRWINLVTVQVINTTYHEGWSVGYTGFVDRKKGLIRPYELSIGQENVKTSEALDRGYESAILRTIRPRFYYLYKRIIPGLYAAFSLSMPLGYEELEDVDGDDSINFIIGAGASQGIRIIPWEKTGVVIGADFLQQFQTSRVYRRDIGFELVFGINF